MYLKEMASVPLLSREQELRLAKAALRQEPLLLHKIENVVRQAHGLQA